MPNTYKILSVFLALMLAGSNMAFSSHVSSHAPTDSSLCSLCIHPGGSESAIVSEPGAFFVIAVANTLSPECSSTPILPVFLHDHQSRAPPTVT